MLTLVICFFCRLCVCCIRLSRTKLIVFADVTYGNIPDVTKRTIHECMNVKDCIYIDYKNQARVAVSWQCLIYSLRQETQLVINDGKPFQTIFKLCYSSGLTYGPAYYEDLAKLDVKLIMKKCQTIKTKRIDCQIELKNQLDYKQVYWVSKDSSVTLQGISWSSGYPILNTNLVISVKLSTFKRQLIYSTFRLFRSLSNKWKLEFKALSIRFTVLLNTLNSQRQKPIFLAIFGAKAPIILMKIYTSNRT